MPADPTATPALLLQIEKLVHGGRGLAHRESLALFVAGVLPGERVLAQPGRIKKGYGEARLFDIVQPSQDRVAAPCPVYGRCGGCQLQHASATAQLELKRGILSDTLTRIGGISHVYVPPVMASPDVYGYRNRARLAVVATGGENGAPSLAYFEEGSHRLVPITHCPLLAPRLNETVALLNRLLGMSRAMASHLQEISLGLSATTGNIVLQYMADRCTRGQADAWFEQVRVGLSGVQGQAQGQVQGQVMVAGRGPQQRRWTEGDATLIEQVGSLRLQCSDRSFAQANWKLNESLVATMTAWAMEGPSGAAAPRRVLELYAGIGNFGLAMAREGLLVTFVEGNVSALRDARDNARVNHIGRCRFRPLSVEAFLAGATPGDYDLVLMDPPRTGLSHAALAGLAQLKAGRLLYLSCDPPTLARDLRALQEAGYGVTRLQAFDMFPQTAHIETLVELAVPK